MATNMERLDYESPGTSSTHRPERWFDVAGDLLLLVIATRPWLLMVVTTTGRFGMGSGGAVCLCLALYGFSWLTVIPRLVSGDRKNRLYRCAVWCDVLFGPFFLSCVVFRMFIPA